MSQMEKLFSDRFIPQRAKENFEISYYSLNNDIFDLNDIMPPKSPTYTNYARKLFARREYLHRLWEVIEPIPRKILNFNRNRLDKDGTNKSMTNWPVKPRRKPLILSPEIILDIPELNANLCYNLLDWSVKGDIASFYNGEIIMWHDNKTKTLSLSEVMMNVQFCLKWNPSGTRLAVALEKSKLMIIEISKKCVFFRKSCCTKKYCTITSFTWTKSETLISGCSNGVVRAWCLINEVRRSICRAHKGVIIGLKFSCNEHYLATSGLDNTIRIWKWPTFEHHFEMCFNLPVKAFAWHPWEESLFVSSGGEKNPSIIVWNVCKFDGIKQESINCGAIDAITFNKNSGELVVSFYDAATQKAYIAVFAKIGDVRDAIMWHLGRVPYLLWNGDGTELLTAGSDEYLCIWEFFGQDKKGSVPKSKKETIYTTNCVKNLNCFRQNIR